jgi:hypothetical protein
MVVAEDNVACGTQNVAWLGDGGGGVWPAGDHLGRAEGSSRTDGRTGVLKAGTGLGPTWVQLEMVSSRWGAGKKLRSLQVLSSSAMRGRLDGLTRGARS